MIELRCRLYVHTHTHARTLRLREKDAMYVRVRVLCIHLMRHGIAKFGQSRVKNANALTTQPLGLEHFKQLMKM